MQYYGNYDHNLAFLFKILLYIKYVYAGTYFQIYVDFLKMNLIYTFKFNENHIKLLPSLSEDLRGNQSIT